MNTRQTGTEPKTTIGFHGDADGISAAVMVMEEEQGPFTLISGLKTEMNLAATIRDSLQQNPNVDIYILDVPLDKNILALEAMVAQLPAGRVIRYIDHHSASRQFPKFSSTSYMHLWGEESTAVIVNGMYGLDHPDWAVVGLSGDGMHEFAYNQAVLFGLDLHKLRETGRALNYNSFAGIEDPTALAVLANKTGSAVEFSKEPVIKSLLDRLGKDYREVSRAKKGIFQDNNFDVILLPEHPASAELIAEIANDEHERRGRGAYLAVIAAKGDGYAVSFRGQRRMHEFAAVLGGGGRETAAGAHTTLTPAEIIDTLRRSNVYKQVTCAP